MSKDDRWDNHRPAVNSAGTPLAHQLTPHPFNKDKDKVVVKEKETPVSMKEPSPKSRSTSLTKKYPRPRKIGGNKK